MEKVKESAANVGASATSGMEKTKAVLQEKADQMKAKDPAEKQVAADKKEHRIQQAELAKKAACDCNAAAKQHDSACGGTNI